ncbi:hypothetical protein [Hydrogenimonas sp.]
MLVLREKSGFVYGFEREMAALAMEVDEVLARKGSVEETVETLRSHAPEKLLYDMATLLRYGSKNDESYEPPMDLGQMEYDGLEGTVGYAVSEDFAFFVRYPDSSWRETIAPQFAHMPPAKEPTGYDRAVLVSFRACGGGLWQLLFNGREVAAPVPKASMPLVLQENLIIAYYQKAPYLMALHAAAVGRNKRAVVMPGVSGSGKSTLAAHLACHGFELYSDEIAWVQEEGGVAPLPFALNVKEGSWEIVSEACGSLEERPSHLRFDGNKVKLLPPRNLAREEGAVEALVFPRYVSGGECRLEPLSACEALGRIRESGYQLCTPLTRENFEKILEYLLSRECYELRYGSLSGARRRIEALMEE